MVEIKIVLADDHALIRAGYRSILEDVEDIKEDLEQALAAV